MGCILELLLWFNETSTRDADLLIVAQFVTQLSLLIGLMGTGQPELQQRANRADDGWKWSDEKTKLAHYLENEQSMFEVELVEIDIERPWRSGKLRISDASQSLLEVEAHGETPFIIDGSVLVYARHHAMASGCELVAIDLTTSERLWSQALIGLGPISHSKYRNQLNLEKVDDRVVVYGRESAGRYIESVELATGRRLTHQRLARE